MGSTESSHAMFFNYAVEDKIEEIMELLPARVDLLIERMIPLIRATDPTAEYDTTMFGLTREELNRTENTGLLLKNMLDNPDFAKRHVEKQERQSLLMHCKVFKIHPSVMTDDEIREKERELFRKQKKRIACNLRINIHSKKQGFIEAMAGADPTTRPQVVFDEYMREFYSGVDSSFEITYSDVMCYLAGVMSPLNVV